MGSELWGNVIRLKKKKNVGLTEKSLKTAALDDSIILCNIFGINFMSGD